MSGFDFTHNQKLLLCVLIGLAAIGLSVSHARRTGCATSSVTLREPGGSVVVSGSEPAPAPAPASRPGSGTVTVHVVGGVRNPGVYTLPEDSRVVNAIDAAGGAVLSADLEAINLASKLQDGSQINVPVRATTFTAVGVGPQPSTVQPPPQVASRESGGKLKSPGEGVVHINSADAGELQRLPGVGSATAQKILEYRNQIGGFSQPEQLSEVKGIGPKKWEKMRPFVAL